jgi:anti-anti-sigma factor
MAGAPALAAAVEQGSDNYCSSLVIDLTECPFIDSGGLNVLLQAIRRLDETTWLGLVGANADLRRVFEIIGLASAPALRLLDEFPVAHA